MKIIPVAVSVYLTIANAQQIPNLFPYPNLAGIAETQTANGAPIDATGPFFQALGSNGRSCFSCHRPAQGWSITPEEVGFRYLVTHGRDPIFNIVDGADCDNLNSLQAARPANHRMLLKHGLIRIEMPVPADAEFNVISVDTTTGCSNSLNLSMYRRPLPSTNLRPLSAVMWDGRESAPHVVDPIFWTRKQGVFRWRAALNNKESQCLKQERITHPA